MADRRDGYSRRGDDRSHYDKDRRRERDDRRHHARDRDRDRDRDRERDRDRDRDRERDRDRDHRRYRSRSRSRDRDRDRERDRDRADRRRSRSPGRDRDRDRERDRDRGYDRDRRDSEKDRDRRRRDGDSEKQRGDRSVRGEVEQRDDAFRRGSTEPAARRSASPKPRGGGVFEREAGEAALPTRTKPPAATTTTTTTAAPPSQPGHGSTGLSFKVKPPSGNSSNHSRTNSHGNGPENPQHDHSHNQHDRGRSPSRDNRFDDHDGGDPMDEDEEEIVVEDEGLDDMAAMMGFGGFGSTKGKKVLGNNVGAARKEKQTKYRQYMNRVGGFNRPLSPTR